MVAITDQTIHDYLVFGLTALIAGYALWALVALLRRSRPQLTIGLPIAAALVIRVLAAGGTSLTGIGDYLRGPDENQFVTEAYAIADGTLSFGGALVGQLYEFVFAVQLAAFDSPDLALRLTQGAIAVGGLALLAGAIYELAGPRAAVLSAWLLAFEPTNLFFTTLLHKEANMMLAAGLVAFGGANMWRRGELSALLPMILGCLIAVATRPYAGWFLIAAAAAITLHAGLRSEHRGSARALSLVSVVVVFGAIAAPTVFEASSDESLGALQVSQDANAADEEANLSLERVDFSTRGAIFTNLPQRMFDITFRPFPWQIDNASQQLGLIGTIVALFLLGTVVRFIYLSWGNVMSRAGPLVYTTLFLLIAYSLSAGNAGTAFRYRMHLVALVICVAVVLRERLRERATDRVEARPEPRGHGFPDLRSEPGRA